MIVTSPDPLKDKLWKILPKIWLILSFLSTGGYFSKYLIGLKVTLLLPSLVYCHIIELQGKIKFQFETDELFRDGLAIK
jgi:hypothetical protein